MARRQPHSDTSICNTRILLITSLNSLVIKVPTPAFSRFSRDKCKPVDNKMPLDTALER